MPAGLDRPRKKKRRLTKASTSSHEAPASGAFPSESLLRRWHALAKRRLLDYADFYRSGRWTLYYESREQFAALMVKVIETEKVWARLAGVSPATDDDLRPAA
jgi:hypothetical protein